MRIVMKKSKEEIESRILSLTKSRGAGKSVSPSEVARDLFSNVWEEHLDEVRGMAGELQAKGKIRIIQQGKPINIDRAKGPIRLSAVDDDQDREE
ncbi:MAG: DUF3253 domain-containing protein [Balneolaceae bacterium]|nr:DUF3253 domain-containing protein [Balneolaceae bacterium]